MNCASSETVEGLKAIGNAVICEGAIPMLRHCRMSMNIHKRSIKGSLSDEMALTIYFLREESIMKNFGVKP